MQLYGQTLGPGTSPLYACMIPAIQAIPSLHFRDEDMAAPGRHCFRVLPMSVVARARRPLQSWKTMSMTMVDFDRSLCNVSHLSPGLGEAR
jgi:hypothetical protein